MGSSARLNQYGLYLSVLMIKGDHPAHPGKTQAGTITNSVSNSKSKRCDTA